MWPGWALRLMPPEGFDFLPCRAALAMMLAIASTGAEDYRTAQELLGLDPFHYSRLATFTARLREHGILDLVTAALCQLARSLEENGTPHRLRPATPAAAILPGPARHRQLAPPALLPHPPRHLGRAPPPRPRRTAPPPRCRNSSPGSA